MDTSPYGHLSNMDSFLCTNNILIIPSKENLYNTDPL